MTDQSSPAEKSANSANILKFVIQLLENIPTPILIHNDVVTSIHFLKDLQAQCEAQTAALAEPVAAPVVEGPVGETPPVVEPPAPVFTVSELPGEGMAKLAAHQEAKRIAKEKLASLSKEQMEAIKADRDARLAKLRAEPAQPIVPMSIEEARKVARERREAQRLEREAKKGENK